MTFPLRTRTDEGVVLPTQPILLAILAVAVAAAGFVLTMHPTKAVHAQVTAAKPKPTPVVTPTPTAQPKPKPKPRPVVNKGDVYVEIYNNSGIRGLAGATAGRARDAGWNVVASDNWYGTIPGSTVYYPARLQAAAKMLAKDLGIHRLMPAVAPMKFDRLTVILTTDYH